MQVMFYRQHFGSLAIGLSNVDKELHAARQVFHQFNSQRVYDLMSIDGSGVNSPWFHKFGGDKNCFAVRVAIVGERLICDENDSYGNKARLYAKVEMCDREIYLVYWYPGCLIPRGLPDPTQMAASILKSAREYMKAGSLGPISHQKWIPLVKDEVPRKFRSLLGKVMSRVGDAICQGPTFFRDPKAR